MPTQAVLTILHCPLIMQAHSTVGLLDECTERVLGILETQLFGHVAEEKEVAAVVGALREGKRTRSYDCYQLLAQCTTTRTHLTLLLGLVRFLCSSPWVERCI